MIGIVSVLNGVAHGFQVLDQIGECIAGLRFALAAVHVRPTFVTDRFHRFAHHPLCAAYAGEVVALGRRTRVCRGCALAAGGAALGAAAAALLPRPSAAAALAAALAFGALASAAVWRRPGARLPKALTRFAPAALGGLAFAAGLRAATVAGGLAALAAALGAAFAARAYRRRGPDRSTCERCPERASPRPCAGLRPILRREAAFRRLAGQWLR